MTPRSQGLADATVVAKVNSVLWDLDRPLEEDCSLQLVKFDDDEGELFTPSPPSPPSHLTGQQVFWHSSAHILGEAMERHYGGCLCYGPPIEGGYFYDMHLEGRQVSPGDFPQLETLFGSIVKEKQLFQRLEMSKEDLLEMFKVMVM